MIGVVIPDILNEYFASMVNGIEKMFLQERYGILIQSTNYDPVLEEKGLRNLADYNVEAVIIAYQPGEGCAAMLRDYGRPIVIIEGGSLYGGIPCINMDNFYGGWIAAACLLEQGRRRIAYVGQNTGIEALRERRRGYGEAMEAYKAGPGMVVETSGPGNKWEEGIKLGEQLLQYPLDGIVVSADAIAVGILKSLLTAGKRVPQDVAVVGYDDIPLAKLFVPALSTVAQPITEICSMAVDKIMRALRGEPVSSELLKPRLILRETT
jgi:DNA-binding LacI/PurR family transcriptional regulator